MVVDQPDQQQLEGSTLSSQRPKQAHECPRASHDPGSDAITRCWGTHGGSWGEATITMLKK